MNTIAYKSAWIDWINEYHWPDSYAITLTFPANVAKHRELVMKKAKLFLNRLDVAAYKNAARRNNHRCRRVIVVEGGRFAMNYHLHGIIKTPEGYSKEMFLMMMHLNWKITTQGKYDKSPFRCQIDEIRLDEDGRTGWISYLSKTLHPQNADAFCPETTWLK